MGRRNLNCNHHCSMQQCKKNSHKWGLQPNESENSKSAEVSVTLYNQKVHGSSFKVRDHVWVLFPQTPRGKSKKLYRPWSGPFLVIKKLSDVTYGVQEVKNHWRRLVVPFNWLKPYKGKIVGCQPYQREVSSDMQTQSEEPYHHHFGSLNWQTRETSMFQLSPHKLNTIRNQGLNPQEKSLHELNTIWNWGLNPKGKCQILLDTTPSEFAAHPTDLVMSILECEDAFLQERELCSVCVGILD